MGAASGGGLIVVPAATGDRCRVRRVHLERLRSIAAARVSIGAMVRTARPTVALSILSSEFPLEYATLPSRTDSFFPDLPLTLSKVKGYCRPWIREWEINHLFYS